MKCFYHSEKDAVAICKNCGKGLCIECAAEVPNGVACKGKCEEEAEFLNKMIQRNKTLLNKSAGSYYRNSIIYVVFGILFLVFGSSAFNEINELKYFMYAFSIAMFFAAILTFISGKKIKDK